MTAHSKTKLISEKADLNGCEACHGGARDHVDFFLGVQKLNAAGKEDEATALSTNPKLLTRNLVRFLCIECHSNTPELAGDGAGLGTQTPNSHDLTQPRYRNCTACHLDIHGSNSDFNLRLLPQRAVRFNVGYGRSMAKGRYSPTYSFQRDIFQLFGDTRWEANDYRLGMDATYRKWDFNVEQLYRNFHNDPKITSRPGGDLGFNPTDNGRITLLDRVTPQHSRALVTRASVRGNVADRLHLVVRI